MDPYFKALELDEISPVLEGPEPTPAFLDSVAKFGILHPILVRHKRKGESTYEVLDGRRRVKAARKLSLALIPAIILITSGEQYRAAVSLISNRQRRENLSAEADALETLLAGTTVQNVSDDTGIPVGTLRSLLALTRVHPTLRAALESGDVAQTVVQQAAKLPQEQQQRLAEAFEETGKLTAKDVRHGRMVRVEAALNDLPDDLFTTPVFEVEEACSCTCGKLGCASRKGL